MEKVRLGSGGTKSFRFEGDRSFCDPRGVDRFHSPQDRTGCPLSTLPLRAACPRDQREPRRIAGNRVADPLLAFSRGCQTTNSPFPSFARSLCLWSLAPLTSSNAVILVSTFKGRKKMAEGVVSFQDYSGTWHPVSVILVGETWRVLILPGFFFGFSTVCLIVDLRFFLVVAWNSCIGYGDFNRVIYFGNVSINNAGYQ